MKPASLFPLLLGVFLVVFTQSPLVPTLFASVFFTTLLALILHTAYPKSKHLYKNSRV